MITFGTDPEFILCDKNSEKPVNAIELLEGNIYNRVTIKGNQFYSDNVLAECAVKPAKTRKQAADNIKETLQTLSDMVAPYKISDISAVDFDQSQLQCNCADDPKWDGEHRLCPKHFGCDPDICAYQMKTMEPPKVMADGTLRSAGGHIHLGGSAECLEGGEKTYKLIYLLDLLLGIPSLFMEVPSEAQKKRRTLYGQAGRYRMKDYGLEYRTLSNFWLRSPRLVNMVYDMCMFAIKFVDRGDADRLYEIDMDKFYETEGDGLKSWKFHEYSRKELVRCINEQDKDGATKFYHLAVSLLDRKLAVALSDCIENRNKFNFYDSWPLRLS